VLNSQAGARRAIPSVDRLLNLEDVGRLITQYGRPLVVETIRGLLDEERAALDRAERTARNEQVLINACAERLAQSTTPTLKTVFNLTGTVLHTNLGRAQVAPSAAQAALNAMTHAVNLEYDLEGGERGERDDHARPWLKRLTGAEAAVVVNNNAAAVYLVLNTLAPRKEVIVSRGELVEIGGAFRIPDIMSRSGCRLREVGTTNRTHASDFRDAINARTAAIMKVHTSNYQVQGFVSSVPERELAEIAHERGLPFIVDLGSGTLVDLERYGLPHEPTPRDAIGNGADLVTFSGDKLLGGPQCGLIIGRADLIAKVKKNPMKRALRVDKMTLAALDATLRLYADPERLTAELPTLRDLTRARGDIEAQAQRLLPVIAVAVAPHAEARLIACASQIGSGALPVDALPSCGIAIRPRGKRRSALAQALAGAFRALPVPVIGRVKDGDFIIDLRCLTDETAFTAQLPALKVSWS
jgi:L-seryl-tRNA(Ser) seleniumtransferase